MQIFDLPALTRQLGFLIRASSQMAPATFIFTLVQAYQ